VTAVNVKENDYVREGDLLVQLSNSDDSYSYTKSLNDLKMQSLADNLEAAREKLDDYVIYAPISGMFVSQPISREDYVTSNQVVCTIVDPDSMEFVTDVDELDIDKVDVGQSVDVSFDAIADTLEIPVKGTVKKIAIEGTSSGGVATYGVTIGIEPSGRIKAGMNADGLIYIESKSDVVVVPVEAVTLIGNSLAYVYVVGESTESAADGAAGETASGAGALSGAGAGAGADAGGIGAGVDTGGIGVGAGANTGDIGAGAGAGADGQAVSGEARSFPASGRGARAGAGAMPSGSFAGGRPAAGAPAGTGAEPGAPAGTYPGAPAGAAGAGADATGAGGASLGGGAVAGAGASVDSWAGTSAETGVGAGAEPGAAAGAGADPGAPAGAAGTGADATGAGAASLDGNGAAVAGAGASAETGVGAGAEPGAAAGAGADPGAPAGTYPGSPAGAVGTGTDTAGAGAAGGGAEIGADAAGQLPMAGARGNGGWRSPIFDGMPGAGYYEGSTVRIVEIGVSNDTHIEIVSGLDEGEIIVLPLTIGGTDASAQQMTMGGGMMQFGVGAPAGGGNQQFAAPAGGAGGGFAGGTRGGG
jgi:hypothetical protein